MFTGIIEEIGTVKQVAGGANSSRVTIGGSVIFTDLKLGDSVSTNGVCLTVSEMTASTFTADIMHETLKATSLANLTTGTNVNLERAMPANGRFGGHIVSGHVDGVGKVLRVEKDDNAIIYTIVTTAELIKYVIKKGSIAIDGISLTVSDVSGLEFSVSIIPHTLKETILSQRDVGSVVNLEVDMMAKYLEKFLAHKEEQAAKINITADFLAKNGF